MVGDPEALVGKVLSLLSFGGWKRFLGPSGMATSHVLLTVTKEVMWFLFIKN